MKILIYSCHFAPEPIGIGKFVGETASWLASQGHDVRVIAALPHYPHRQIAEGYRSGRYQRRNENNVDVLHCPLWISRGQSGLGRVLQYLVFSATSAPVVIGWGLTWRPDVLITVIPPTSALPAAILGAALGSSAAWVHVQDFDIDAAFELNFLRSRFFRSALLWMERVLMSCNRVVSTITPAMLERLRVKRVKAELVLFPNWADIDSISPMAVPNPLRAELGIPQDAFVAAYSGNLGEKQGINCLVEVARLVADRPDIRIIIGGDGAGRARLAELAGGLGNLQLVDLQPQHRLNEMINLADVHLLPQRAAAADLVMPSKLGGMLASGRPVIAGAEPGTQLANEVEGCGIVVPPDDPAAMASALLAIRDDAGRRSRLGIAARERALSHWNKQAILKRFEDSLLAMRKV